jgi:hypothetical protein
MNIISSDCIHIDDIINATSLSPGDTLSSLMALELKGLVQQFPGKYFSSPDYRVRRNTIPSCNPNHVIEAGCLL